VEALERDSRAGALTFQPSHLREHSADTGTGKSSTQLSYSSVSRRVFERELSRIQLDAEQDVGGDHQPQDR
jgi:hypothetical protein